MAFRFLSHPWTMQYKADGILLECTHKDLDAMTVPVLIDELYTLVLENGLPNLYLDFSQVNSTASAVIGKLVALDARLKKAGGRLVLCNVDPVLHETLEAAHIADTLEVRVSEYQAV
jgi:anti-sigma B factor antagonist